MPTLWHLILLDVKSQDVASALIHNEQCAVWAVRWSCSILAIAVKTLSHGKTIFLRLFFLCSFSKKTLKLVSLFIFQHRLFHFSITNNKQGDSGGVLLFPGCTLRCPVGYSSFQRGLWDDLQNIWQVSFCQVILWQTISLKIERGKSFQNLS